MLCSEDDDTGFWEKIDVRGPDECWPWLRYRMPAGYGTVTIGGKLKLAHN